MGRDQTASRNVPSGRVMTQEGYLIAASTLVSGFPLGGPDHPFLLQTFQHSLSKMCGPGRIPTRKRFIGKTED